VASLRLTEQARMLLESGNVDDAITTLERAMNVNPSNGQNYYYLAEAWLTKGNLSQAREFNRLAAMYLRDDPDWMNRVRAQQERIKPR
jgi:predicted Zn-dependent protease